MISQIYVKNFAIVEELDLDLSTGMTALTGETGAGKSILLDAIGLTLGDRANSGTVRHGCDKADISVSFDIKEHKELSDWLKDNELFADHECIIRRVVSAEGRSKCFINGSPVNLQMLKQAGELLVDIHGQHEHQSLTKKDTQRDILDSFSETTPILKELNLLFLDWKNTKKSIEEISSSITENNAKKEFLRFQIEELEALSLEDGEYSNLENELKILANSDNIISNCQKAAEALTEAENYSAQTAINQAISAIDCANEDNEKLNSISEMLNSALIQVEESSSELCNYAQSIDTDPERLSFVENRISQINDIARKHSVSPSELNCLLDSFNNELNSIEHSAETVDELNLHLEETYNKYIKLADSISTKRVNAAESLSKKITSYMQELGMSGGKFVIDVIKSESDTPQFNGLDSIEYTVSANAGQPLMPLGKVASGGELSRISLALQVAVTDNTSIPTLIFDEVDTGIGGGIAEVVGQKLRELGEKRQVLCVTHLPQVASKGHNQFKVEKSSTKNNTNTNIIPLDNNGRLNEIARMLGGVDITENAINHAKEMLYTF